MVDTINANRAVHIVTIEDPIEVIHEDKLAMVNQREVGIDTEDFAIALRAAMRQDPDVILVGEMRDPETVKAALAAAETGHFVMSTLHTTDAKETVNRIIDFFPPHEQKQVRLSLAGALRGIVCQRLVPRADGRAGRSAMEIAVNTGRVAEADRRPGQDRRRSRELIADGRLLRHADLRPAPGPAGARRHGVDRRREAGQLQHPRLLGDAQAGRAWTQDARRRGASTMTTRRRRTTVARPRSPPRCSPDLDLASCASYRHRLRPRRTGRPTGGASCTPGSTCSPAESEV